MVSSYGKQSVSVNPTCEVILFQENQHLTVIHKGTVIRQTGTVSSYGKQSVSVNPTGNHKLFPEFFVESDSVLKLFPEFNYFR